jgi:hypothetical protein
MMTMIDLSPANNADIYPSICNSSSYCSSQLPTPVVAVPPFSSSSSFIQMNNANNTNFFDYNNVIVPSISSSSEESLALCSSPPPPPPPSSSSSPSFELRTTTMEINNNFTVVIAKGKIRRTAKGNSNLKTLVRNHLQEYMNATSRMIKSCIVTNIYDTIQLLCQQDSQGNSQGFDPAAVVTVAFVRYDVKSGYVPAIEAVAREKITATFRDCLSDQYKSSSRNKVAKRRLANDIIKLEKEKEKYNKYNLYNQKQRQQHNQRRENETMTMAMTTTQLSKETHKYPVISAAAAATTTTLKKTAATTTTNKNNSNNYNKDTSTAAATHTASMFDEDDEDETTFEHYLPNNKFKKIDTFSEFLGPVDISVFDDVPLPNQDCASTSSSNSSSRSISSSSSSSGYLQSQS